MRDGLILLVLFIMAMTTIFGFLAWFADRLERRGQGGLLARFVLWLCDKLGM